MPKWIAQQKYGNIRQADFLEAFLYSNQLDRDKPKTPLESTMDRINGFIEIGPL